MSKSLFGQLCAYLMSCDTHHRTCPRYLPKECSRQVSKKFDMKKIFRVIARTSMVIRTDRQTDGQTDGRTDRQTDRQTDRRTDAGNNNTPPALGPRGKNTVTIHYNMVGSPISSQLTSHSLPMRTRYGGVFCENKLFMFMSCSSHCSYECNIMLHRNMS